ncbi:uncharacterized protein N7482_004874 [Penicillium canariense]|uniref:Uncharacterized protein n=1 Tax=Penicillium canariense TaxID=189055 RepID=A0A9W9I3S4_9EURO|nr:uncharacterized protein N7482_004874 [Penicillium canariense]KAJ5166093.1 hypothetical protein N7482_004874 [Penicillium canariense]
MLTMNASEGEIHWVLGVSTLPSKERIGRHRHPLQMTRSCVVPLCQIVESRHPAPGIPLALLAPILAYARILRDIDSAGDLTAISWNPTTPQSFALSLPAWAQAKSWAPSSVQDDSRWLEVAPLPHRDGASTNEYRDSHRSAVEMAPELAMRDTEELLLQLEPPALQENDPSTPLYRLRAGKDAAPLDGPLGWIFHLPHCSPSSPWQNIPLVRG